MAICGVSGEATSDKGWVGAGVSHDKRQHASPMR
jgi:hypothetical protein